MLARFVHKSVWPVWGGTRSEEDEVEALATMAGTARGHILSAAAADTQQRLAYYCQTAI